MEPDAHHKSDEVSRRTDRYWVPVVARTLDVLDCFVSGSEQLSLDEIVQRTHVPHTTAFRILHTLVSRQYLLRTGRKYSLNALRKRLKLGFANLSRQISLAVEIQNSLEQATAGSGFHLHVLDNNRNADVAIRNAERMVDDKVDVAIEFQLFEHVAPVIAEIFSRAQIPLISVVNPHPGTLYFGVNNYRAGFSGGMALAEYAGARWQRRPDALLLLESPHAGRTVQSRLIGVLRGVEARLGVMNDRCVHHLDSGGGRATSRSVVDKFLRAHSAKRILIAGVNDESAIGALEAAEQKGGAELAVVGHGGSGEMMEIVADPQRACIGTVSFHAELYGPDLIEFALASIQRKPGQSARYVPHEFVGKEMARRNKTKRSVCA